jgi:hypothetical protein
MTRIKLPYVHAVRTKGNRYYYFRKPGCEARRLPGVPGTAEFMIAYQAALDGAPELVTEIGAART